MTWKYPDYSREYGLTRYPGAVEKIAAYIPITGELAREIDQLRRPWRYPDPHAITNIDPFPGWSRLRRLINLWIGRPRPGDEG